MGLTLPPVNPWCVRGPGISPDTYCCTSLIKAYGMKGEAEKALDVVRMMIELGLRPDLVTYNTLIDACEKNGRLEEATRIFRQELPEQGLKPDIFTYTVMLNMHGKRGKFAEALGYFEEAIRVGLRPELPAFTAIIKVRIYSTTNGPHVYLSADFTNDRFQEAAVPSWCCV